MRSKINSLDISKKGFSKSENRNQVVLHQMFEHLHLGLDDVLVSCLDLCSIFHLEEQKMIWIHSESADLAVAIQHHSGR